MGQGGEKKRGGGGGWFTTEKCNTRTRQNSTIRPENRTRHRGSSPVPRTRGWLPLALSDNTNSQEPPHPPPPTRGSWWDAGTFGREAGNGQDGSKAQGEVSRTGAAPRVRDEGSEADTRGTWGRGKRLSHPRPQGPFSAFGEQDPRFRPPPHLLFLTSRCLSLCLHHNPRRHSRKNPSHFPLSRLSRCRELRRTPRPAKHRRHFRSGKHRLPHPGFFRIGWCGGPT